MECRATRVLLHALLILPLLLALAPLHAAGLSRLRGPLVDLQVVDRDSGRVLPQYSHGGQAWLPGDPGRSYAVRLRNLGAERVLVVLSVDGVNAVSGQTADPRQAGYVLGPWQSLDVDGWRKSLESVARFVFVDPAASYASRTGRPENVGVIGVAVFREAAPPSPVAVAGPGAMRRGGSAEQARIDGARQAPASGAVADMAAQGESIGQGLGTGHGAIGSSPAYATGFERQSRPAQVSQLRYDTWHGLQARGIVAPSNPSRAWDGAPQAFPGGFVPDPPCCAGWPR